MIRYATALLVAALVASPATAAAAVGQPAPDFVGTDVSGRTVRLSDYRGKVVVLEWTSPACPFVEKHYATDQMQTLQADARAGGAVWISINSSASGKPGSQSAEAARAALRDDGATPDAYVLDGAGTIGRTYGARTTPHLFVIGSDGRLAYAGAIDDMPTADPADLPKARNLVRAALADLAAGRPVAQPTSQPYGCSVKY